MELTNEAKDLMNRPMELIGWILQRHHEAMLEEVRDQVKKLVADRNEFRDKYHDLLLQVEQKYPGESRHETAKRLIQGASVSGCATADHDEQDSL